MDTKNRKAHSKEAFEAAFSEVRSKALVLQEAGVEFLSTEEKLQLLAFYNLEQAILDRKAAWDRMNAADITVIRMFDVLDINLEEFEVEGEKSN